MWVNLRQRSQQSFQTAIALLDDMASSFDPRAVRALTTPDIPYTSTASAPSLRAREAAVPLPANMGSPDNSTVKVVVRVRKFIKRGELS